MDKTAWSSPRYSPEARAALQGAALQRAAALRNDAVDAAASAAARWLRSTAQRALRRLSMRPDAGHQPAP
jgi:hypothetical protein